jgi:hypothetical protein
MAISSKQKTHTKTLGMWRLGLAEPEISQDEKDGDHRADRVDDAGHTGSPFCLVPL